jgi:hypothetical protein
MISQIIGFNEFTYIWDMVSDQPLKNIDQVLEGIRIQIIDSYNYCYENFSGYDNAEQLFNALKPIIRFKHDPHKIELVQTAETLLEANKHGKSGLGDCDCFTVLAIACFVVNGWLECDIVLTGRSKTYPVHIYTQVNDGYGMKVFDLTNGYIDVEREYPMKQVLPLKFN